MTPFSYQAATAEGRLVSGQLEAGSPDAVRSELRRRGLYPVEVRAAGGRAGGWIAWAGLHSRLAPRPSAVEISRELAALLAAGLTLDRSLGLLGDVFRDPATAELLTDLRGRLRRGEPWSTALAAHPAVFPEAYVRVVAAGEEAGRLDVVVGSLAAHLERRAELRDRIRGALLYPVLMAGVGGLALLVLLVFVLPKFVAILEEAERGLPVSTAILLGAGRLVGELGWLLALLAAAAAAGLDRWRRTPAGRRYVARLDLRAPVWGSLRREAMVARFAHTLALLLRSGVRVLPALETASRTVGNIIVRERLERAGDQVRKGETLAAALVAEAVPFPALAARMIGVGEESGALPDMLEKVAAVFDRRVERRSDRLVGLIEPGLIVAFGVAVGFVAVAMIQAVFRVQQAPL